MRRIRVLLGSGYPLLWAGVRRILEAEEDFTVVGVAAGEEEIRQLTRAHQPDILVLELRLSPPPCLRLTRSLRLEAPRTRLVALAGDVDPSYGRTLLRQGACAFLLRDSSEQALVSALRQVRAGQEAGLLIPAALLAPGRGPPSLTERERAVLDMVWLGYRNKDIATALACSERAEEDHLHHLFVKFAAHSRVELVRLAREQGWLS